MIFAQLNMKYFLLTLFIISVHCSQNVFNIVLNADFSINTQKYMTSIEMGHACHEFVLDNMEMLGYTNVDEVNMLNTANEICLYYATKYNREYVGVDFKRSFYPHVKRNELTNIYDKYNTDKNSFFHNYGAIYHKHFLPYRQTIGLKYLELGVLGGASLNAMQEYFPLGDRFVGIDIDPNTKIHQDIKKDIYVHIGSQNDNEFLTHVDQMHGPFDIILDDASHIGKITIESFEILFPKLKNGGLYVVEDTVAFRDELAYFQDLIRYGLNSWRFDEDIIGANDHCIDPYKMNRFFDFDNEVTVDEHTQPSRSSLYNKYIIYSSIGEITYSNSCILITKDIKHHWLDNMNIHKME